MADHELYFAGTSGLLTPIPKRDFPPEFKDYSRLAYYASLFNSIEINSSFYKIPIAKTLVKWADSVPAGFRFTFKLWQGITHQKGLAFNPEEVYQFITVINSVSEKRGCLLIQFPPSLTIAASRQLDLLLTTIREADEHGPWQVAVEFRNKSWYEDEVYDLLDAHGATMVLQDLPASATPMIAEDVNFKYLRFHGPGGRYKGSYEPEVLQDYAQLIREWHGDGKTVYVYFNNTAGNALGNLQALTAMLR